MKNQDISTLTLSNYYNLPNFDSKITWARFYSNSHSGQLIRIVSYFSMNCCKISQCWPNYNSESSTLISFKQFSLLHYRFFSSFAEVFLRTVMQFSRYSRFGFHDELEKFSARKASRPSLTFDWGFFARCILNEQKKSMDGQSPSIESFQNCQYI